jgi:hypothetical protein
VTFVTSVSRLFYFLPESIRHPSASKETYSFWNAHELVETENADLPESVETNWQAACLTNSRKRTGHQMIIGAAIAGLLIISLFFEMISSSPKPTKEHQGEPSQIKNA